MWLVAVAGPARGPLAGMIRCIVGVIAAITFMAPITSVHKASKGGASLVMMFALQQNNSVRGIRASENQEKWVLSAQHF